MTRTALSACLSLIPLANAGGEPGPGIQSPMAIVVLGGLPSAVALYKVVVPELHLCGGAAAHPAKSADRQETEATLALEGV